MIGEMIKTLQKKEDFFVLYVPVNYICPHFILK
jgi:hypothetical protein